MRAANAFQKSCCDMEGDEAAKSGSRGKGMRGKEGMRGGGGRGMRIASNDPSLVNAFHAARSEAEVAFKDGTVYLEKFVENPRHVEIQILADRFGSVVWLGERDCSVQRRHQKLIEESPSPALTDEEHAAVCEAAARLGLAANYRNAGTVEFLFDPAERIFSFMEVNARLQVERAQSHAVLASLGGFET